MIAYDGFRKKVNLGKFDIRYPDHYDERYVDGINKGRTFKEINVSMPTANTIVFNLAVHPSKQILSASMSGITNNNDRHS